MGNKEIVDDMEEVLGLIDEESNKSNDEEKQEEKQEETKSNDTVTLTQEQIKVNSELTKIDSKLEELQSNNTVDTDKFYDNLDEYLSDEEQELEFDNKAAYLKVIKEKEKEYIKNNSKDEDIQELQKQKEELQKVYDRQEAISIVSAKYPDFNYEKSMEFYQNDLTPRQQQDIINSAKSYADVYEQTYKIYIQNNPNNIQTQKAPNIPNLNNVRKESVPNSTTKNTYKTDDEELQEALGLI